MTHLEVPSMINIFPECIWPQGGKPLSRKYNKAWKYNPYGPSPIAYDIFRGYDNYCLETTTFIEKVWADLSSLSHGLFLPLYIMMKQTEMLYNDKTFRATI